MRRRLGARSPDLLTNAPALPPHPALLLTRWPRPEPERTDGFEASPYPIILSLEMHCGLEGQAKIAHHLVTLFADTDRLMLPIDPAGFADFTTLHTHAMPPWSSTPRLTDQPAPPISRPADQPAVLPPAQSATSFARAFFCMSRPEELKYKILVKGKRQPELHAQWRLMTPRASAADLLGYEGGEGGEPTLEDEAEEDDDDTAEEVLACYD